MRSLSRHFSQLFPFCQDDSFVGVEVVGCIGDAVAVADNSVNNLGEYPCDVLNDLMVTTLECTLKCSDFSCELNGEEFVEFLEVTPRPEFSSCGFVTTDVCALTLSKNEAALHNTRFLSLTVAFMFLLNRFAN